MSVATMADPDLQRDGLEEPRWEPSVEATHIGVSVKDGTVTLTRHVSSSSEKYAAERDAKRVYGVRAAANELDVKLPVSGRGTDEDIDAAAVNALRSNLAVPADKAKVTVTSGRVTLEGEVERHYQKMAAESAVRDLAGVIGPSNHVIVKPRLSPSELKSKLKDALSRSAEMDARQVTVEVEGSKVILRRTVALMGREGRGSPRGLVGPRRRQRRAPHHRRALTTPVQSHREDRSPRTRTLRENIMSERIPRPGWRIVGACLAAHLVVAGPAWAQQRTSTTTGSGGSRDTGPVVRTFGAQGGFRTEVTSRAIGQESGEDGRQAAILMAEVFEHIGRARNAIDADDSERATREVNKAREGIRAIRAMMPRAVVHTRTTAPDGKVVYEDEEEIQTRRIPLYEGILHAQTLAPILAARRNVMEVAGVQVVESERIATEVVADIDVIESQLERAAKAIEHKRPEDAARALAMALVRGIDLRFSKEDSELASARDQIWLARRSLEENNIPQALANLADARQRLRVYREILPQEQRQEVDQMLQEIDQLEAQLRQEGTRAATREERTRQGKTVTGWWDRINSWFKRHF